MAIKELSKREEIIITKADKGGAVAIVGKRDFIKEAERQLNDKDNFHIWPQDPTLGNSKLANQAIDRFKKEKLITDKIEDALKTSDPRTLRVYITTKLHKSGNLGLSVENSVNYYTAYISK